MFNLKICLSFAMLLCCLSLNVPVASSTPIKIGVLTALTGDSATYGDDTKRVLEFANKNLGAGKYEFVFEDEKCETPMTAVNAANKLINVDHVRYVLGLSCNATVLATAPIFERAGVVVITATASSGDVHELGQHIFRMFPNDALGIEVIARYLQVRYKKLGMLSELTEYNSLVERAMIAESKKSGKMQVIIEQFNPGDADFRSILLKLKAAKIDALFINTGSEGPFMNVLKQALQLRLNVPFSAEYWPGSPAILDTMPKELEGVVYADLPSTRDLMDEKGRMLLNQFVSESGPMKSLEIGFPLAYESFRILDMAIQSGKPVHEYLHQTRFQDGPLGKFGFTKYGEIEGLNFQVKTIKEGKVVVVE